MIERSDDDAFGIRKTNIMTENRTPEIISNSNQLPREVSLFTCEIYEALQGPHNSIRFVT